MMPTMPSARIRRPAPHTIIPALCVLATVVLCGSADAVTLTVNPAVRYQTVIGFGARDNIAPWRVKVGAFYEDVDLVESGFYDTIINGLGLTLLRQEVDPSFEPVNDNDDPATTDWSGFDTALVRSSAQRFLEARAVADAAGSPLLFMATVASPPAWMKANNSTVKRDGEPNNDEAENRLLPQYLDEYAEFCVAYLRAMREFVGVQVDLLSVVNEPTNSLSWTSCVYDPSQVVDVIAEVGARVAAEEPGTKLVMPEEDIGNVPVLESYVSPVLSDAAARSTVGGVCVHAYELAWQKPAVAPPDSTLWADIHGWGASYGLPLLISEAPHFENSWRGSFALVRFLVHALRNGQVSMWAYYDLTGETMLEKNLMVRDSGHSHFQVSRHVYRFVRPGAVQVHSLIDDDSLDAVAFIHPDGIFSAVCVNRSHAEVSLDIGLPEPLDSCEVWVSTDGHSCEHAGSSSTTTGIAVPGQGIVTVTAPVDYEAGVMTRAASRQPQVRAGAALFTLDGRRVQVTTPPLNSARSNGVIVWGRATGAARLLLPCVP